LKVMLNAFDDGGTRFFGLQAGNRFRFYVALQDCASSVILTPSFATVHFCSTRVAGTA
jgi:hypothetical protein